MYYIFLANQTLPPHLQVTKHSLSAYLDQPLNSAGQQAQVISFV